MVPSTIECHRDCQLSSLYSVPLWSALFSFTFWVFISRQHSWHLRKIETRIGTVPLVMRHGFLRSRPHSGPIVTVCFKCWCHSWNIVHIIVMANSRYICLEVVLLGFSVAMKSIFNVNVTTKMHRLMRHIDQYLFFLGCIRHRSSEENEMVHKYSKLFMGPIIVI